MNKRIIIIILLILLAIPAGAGAFQSSGEINKCLGYKNFERGRGRYSGGYVVTFVNNCGDRFYHDFYIKVIGMQGSGEATFSHKVYIDALGPGQEIEYYLPGFDRTENRLTISLIFQVYRPVQTREIQ